MLPGSPLPSTGRFYSLLAALAASCVFGLLVLQLLTMVHGCPAAERFLTPGKVSPLRVLLTSPSARSP